jgi:hypothetical protein
MLLKGPGMTRPLFLMACSISDRGLREHWNRDVDRNRPRWSGARGLRVRPSPWLELVTELPDSLEQADNDAAVVGRESGKFRNLRMLTGFE